MDISCAFATSLQSPEHAAVAEKLGYHQAWFYDSPALYPDVWVALALAAQRTSTIRLGPGVLVPSLRHPLTNASAIATLEAMAPGRVTVAVGSGFTGRLMLGQRPVPWAYVREYVLALQALLRGEQVEWEGGMIQMLLPPGYGAPRPMNVPIVIAAAGPKGFAVAREIGQGAFVAGADPERGIRPTVLLQFGTVLEPGETLESPRVVDAAGHAAGVMLHFLYEFQPEVLDTLPGAGEWRAATDALDKRTRHLTMHDLHLVAVNERDRPYIGPLMGGGLTGDAGAVRAKITELAEAGVTEIAYQPAGSDIPRELRSFAEAAGIA